MSPEAIVRAELNAWATLDVDEIVSYFSADAAGTVHRIPPRPRRSAIFPVDENILAIVDRDVVTVRVGVVDIR